jgi:hypothetical protein
MGKSWFRTAEQDKYLDEQVKDLLNARLDDSVKVFRHRLHETWEARWPEIKVVFPERTDTDPQLTKDQVDELSSAMALRKKVSLIHISVVTFFILRFLFIAIIYPRPLAHRYEDHPHEKSKDDTCSISSQGPIYQGQEGGAQANNACHI